LPSTFTQYSTHRRRGPKRAALRQLLLQPATTTATTKRAALRQPLLLPPLLKGSRYDSRYIRALLS
jgi:hypothetical protein